MPIEPRYPKPAGLKSMFDADRVERPMVLRDGEVLKAEPFVPMTQPVEIVRPRKARRKPWANHEAVTRERARLQRLMTQRPEPGNSRSAKAPWES